MTIDDDYGNLDSSVQLKSSTGQNDSSSIWSSGLLNTLIGTAGSAFGSLNQTNAQTELAKANAKALAANQANQANQSSNTMRLVIFGIVGVVIVVIGIVLLKRK